MATVKSNASVSFPHFVASERVLQVSSGERGCSWVSQKQTQGFHYIYFIYIKKYKNILICLPYENTSHSYKLVTIAVAENCSLFATTMGDHH